MAKKQKFLRTDSHKYSKLGVRRKNKLKYRKGKGGENKMRLKMKGHLKNVSIGFRSEKKKRGLINGLKPVRICNIQDLENLKKGEIGIVAKVGNKKRKEIADYALKNKILLKNLNAKKFLEKIEMKIKESKERKSKRDEKKKMKEKETKKAEKEEEKKTDEKKLEEKVEEKKEDNKQDIVKDYETDIKENVEEIKSI